MRVCIRVSFFLKKKIVQVILWYLGFSPFCPHLHALQMSTWTRNLHSESWIEKIGYTQDEDADTPKLEALLEANMCIWESGFGDGKLTLRMDVLAGRVVSLG